MYQQFQPYLKSEFTLYLKTCNKSTYFSRNMYVANISMCFKNVDLLFATLVKANYSFCTL